jgi:hypothetical protein
MTGDLHARSDYKYYVTINKCDRNNQRQLWECVDESIKHIHSQADTCTTENIPDMLQQLNIGFMHQNRRALVPKKMSVHKVVRF